MLRRPMIAIGATAALALVRLNLAIATPQDSTAPRPGTQAEAELSQPNDAARQVIDLAVAELISNAKALGDYEQEKVTVNFSRPHSAVARIDPDFSLQVLDSMLGSFVDNAYEDTFIRWHLMHVVNQASQKDRQQMGSKLVKLVNQMPEPLQRNERKEYWHIPEDVHSQWWKIFSSLRVVIGYPPYQQRINPPASFAHMDKVRRAEAKVLWKKAVELKERYKTVYDHNAIAHNRRIREVNWIVRQYRGELIYALFWTGDPKMARLIMATMRTHARKNSGIAVDLLAFWYLAAFDGALNLYEPALLSELSSNLERTARANEAWFGYQHRQRNFADYAFHLIYMLREGDLVDVQRTSPTAPTEN